MLDRATYTEAKAELGQLLKLILSFVPWLALMLIARDSLLRVKVGLIVGMILAVCLAIARINKGVILWTSLAFFACATIAIAGLNDLWTLHHLGVLANATLAAVVWSTIVVRKPFTLAYAREQADPARWSDPGFIRTNATISSVWAASLSVNTALAFAKLRAIPAPAVAYDVLPYVILLGAALFTVWYPRHLRRQATGSSRGAR